MVFVDHRFDNLKLLQKSRWKPTPEHPDLHAAHEALQLHEHLTELSRGEAARGKTPEYMEMLAESRAATCVLRDALAATPVNAAGADVAMARVNRSCAACHRGYRN
jgi:cytochrome c556